MSPGSQCGLELGVALTMVTMGQGVSCPSLWRLVTRVIMGSVLTTRGDHNYDNKHTLLRALPGLLGTAKCQIFSAPRAPLEIFTGSVSSAPLSGLSLCWPRRQDADPVQLMFVL